MSVSVQVRGIRRNVFLGRRLGPNKWLAKVYLNTDSVPSGRTSVAGIYQIYANGTRRFTPNKDRSSLV